MTVSFLEVSHFVVLSCSGEPWCHKRPLGIAACGMCRQRRRGGFLSNLSSGRQTSWEGRVSHGQVGDGPFNWVLGLGTGLATLKKSHRTEGINTSLW